MRISFLSAALVLAVVSAESQAAPVVLYDVNFEAPTHIVGNPPTTGSGPNTPSSIVFGAPVISNNFAALPGQSLVFNTTGNTTPCCFYDQIQFNLGNGYSNYNVAFDVSTSNYVNAGSGNTFALLFDTPTVQNLYFENNGTIRTFAGGGSSVIGTFSDNTLLNMNVNVDLLASQWNISMNGTSLFTGTFNASGGDVFNMRYSFGGAGTTNFDSVGLDNVVVSAVPVPAAVWLLGSGLLGLIGVARRKCK